MKLSDIVDLSALQQIQDSFSRATGFGAITSDYRGKPVLEYSCFSPFCQRLREDSRYNELCSQSDAHGSLESARTNSVCIYRCHAGLVDIAIPIIIEGEYVGSMLCGQVVVEKPQDVSMEFMRRSGSIFSDTPELVDMYNNIPVVSYDKIAETANLLKYVLRHIVERYLHSKENSKLLLEQKKKSELLKHYRDMEVKYYHSQIYPHFLFNALNMVSRQAYMEGAERTQEIVYALADICRNSLVNVGMLTTIEQEFSTLSSYMYIQQLRFGEQMGFRIDAPEDMRQCMIPSLLLYTFVENAVRHGLEPKEDLGTVELRCYIKEDRLFFEISDNGRGIPESYLEILNSADFLTTTPPQFKGTGIFNAGKRLQHFFRPILLLSFQIAARVGRG